MENTYVNLNGILRFHSNTNHFTQTIPGNSLKFLCMPVKQFMHNTISIFNVYNGTVYYNNASELHDRQMHFAEAKY